MTGALSQDCIEQDINIDAPDRDRKSIEDAWWMFDIGLGLREHLLPVPQPGVPVSPRSGVQTLGKVPGLINRAGQATGFLNWTQHRTTGDEIEGWSEDTRLGVCLQTRQARGIDIDVEDACLAEKIELFIAAELGLRLPCRMRSNTGKRLLLAIVEGEIAKRTVRLPGGMIEFLGDGQQCVIAGLHPSGVPYRWRYGLPHDIPSITLGAYRQLIDKVAERFGTGEIKSGNLRRRGERLEVEDPVAQWLPGNWEVRGDASGGLYVRCPYDAEHSSDSGPTEAMWLYAGSEGYEQGNFRCLHAHCAQVGRTQFLDMIGYPYPSGCTPDEFPLLPDRRDEGHDPDRDDAMFRAIPAGEFMQGQPARWLVKGVVPQAALGVIYGASGAGKSFFALDLVAAVALGRPWRGLKVRQTNVLYIAAEGAGGFRKRIAAYRHDEQVEFGEALQVIAGAPNFLTTDDPAAIRREARRVRAGLVVIDTLAQVTPGGDENNAVDMGRALKQCQRIHEDTGAMVVLVHHAGKDAARGARGWSGLRAACDFEIEVSAVAGARVARVTKQKDGEDGAEFYFNLVPVGIGIDEDDDLITSCVVRDVGKPTRLRVLNGVPALVWRTFHDLTEPGADSVGEDALVDEVAGQLPRPEGGKRDRRKQDARRALRNLCAEGRLSLRAGLVIAGEGVPHPGAEPDTDGGAA